MKAFLILFFGGLFSKFIGIVREIVFASLFGTSGTAAAFRLSQAAFTAPTHALVLETVSGGLVPLYQRLGRDGEEEQQALVIVAAFIALFVALLIAAALWFCSHGIVRALAPSAPPQVLILATAMTQMMAIAVPFYVLGNLVTFIETAHGQYSALSTRPALLNIASLLAAFAAYRLRLPVLLDLGIVVSHILFLFWTFYVAVKQKSLRLSIPKDFRLYLSAGTMYAINSAPLLMIPLITQLNYVVERIVASFISVSAIPALDYAKFITETVITLSAMPLGLITMSKYGGVSDVAARRNLETNTLLLIFVAFPAGFHLTFVARDAVTLVFAHGAFRASAVEVTSSILCGLGVGLGANVASYFMLRSLSAQLRNKVALYIIAAAVVLNTAVDLTTWKLLGPAALGLGASVYGVTAFAGAAFALSMWSVLVRPLLLVIVMVVVDLVATNLTNGVLGIFLRMALTTTTYMVFWVGFAWFVPSIRALWMPPLARMLRATKRFGRAGLANA